MNWQEIFEKETGWDYSRAINPAGQRAYTFRAVVLFNNDYNKARMEWLESRLNKAVEALESIPQKQEDFNDRDRDFDSIAVLTDMADIARQALKEIKG